MTAIEQLIRDLEASKGDLHAQAVVSAEFFLSGLSEQERTPLRAAIDAGAILRWFDADLLAAVLKIPLEEAQRRFTEMKALPFVERFSNPQRELRNLHEATRLGWRKRLFQQEPARFRALSTQAVTCFTGSDSRHGRIEWIYHLLSADPERGARELEKIARAGSGAHPEERDALVALLKELEDLKLANGKTLVWMHLVRAWADASRGSAAGLFDKVQDILRSAISFSDLKAEADAECLLGDICLAQGKLAEAQAAFTKSLEISQQLAAQDPSNADWQRDLAVAYSRVGGVLRTQGKLAGAQAAFTKCLEISQQLAAQDPSNADW
jgi:tetratricopeptide (TPR) repeat protein